MKTKATRRRESVNNLRASDGAPTLRPWYADMAPATSDAARGVIERLQAPQANNPPTQPTRNLLARIGDLTKRIGALEVVAAQQTRHIETAEDALRHGISLIESIRDDIERLVAAVGLETE